MKKKLFSEIPFIKGNYVTLKMIERKDAAGLKELVDSKAVYRYLPTFLFEKKYDDVSVVIDRMYNECFKESIILGVFKQDEFCGIAEMYGYREEYHKISVGYRLIERFWGQGIATETLRLMIDHLYNERIRRS